jgi:hypothetical protein
MPGVMRKTASAEGGGRRRSPGFAADARRIEAGAARLTHNGRLRHGPDAADPGDED